MNIKLIAYLAITSNYINSINGVNSSINKQPLLRCNSTPNLRQLYNSTYSTIYTATHNAEHTAIHNDISNSNIISSSEYKTNIYNKNKRNTYLRTKERYTFDNQ
jgi:hypothetical protein